MDFVDCPALETYRNKLIVPTGYRKEKWKIIFLYGVKPTYCLIALLFLWELFWADVLLEHIVQFIPAHLSRQRKDAKMES